MGKLEDEKRVYNCQINYIIIHKLWRYLGKDPEDLYFKLGITGNKYSNIRTGAFDLTFLKKKWKQQDSSLKKFGLPEEIMLGYSAIEIKGISRDDWISYIDTRYDSKEENRKNYMRNFNNKLHVAFSNLSEEKNLKSNIGKLYLLIKYNVSSDYFETDREMKELHESLKQITTEHIKACDNILREEVHRYMKEVLYKIDVITAYSNLTNT